jgi:peptidoglycan/LPS O-acetylase OafA/YrhL
VDKGLTSFRALAFFAIFLYHVYMLGSGHLGIEGGYLGIEAFFVLSGFLLTPILVGMKSSLNKKDFFIHFYGRRALRIFPLFYSYIALTAFVSFWVLSQYGPSNPIPQDRIEFIYQFFVFIKNLPWSVTYAYDFYHTSYYYKASSFDTHFWSLAVEEQFYLVWPFAIFFIPAKYLKKFLLIVIVTVPLVRFFTAMTVDADIIPLNKSPEYVIYLLPFSYIDAFAIGGYFSLYKKGRSSFLVWLIIIFVLLLGVVTSWLSSKQFHWGDFGYVPLMNGTYKYVWGYSAVNLMFAYVLIHVRDKIFMPALFENPLLVYLGKISYGLYLFHLPVLWLLYSTLKMYSTLEMPTEILLVSTSLLITIFISMISYELMEKRFINLKDKYFARASDTK